MTLHTIATPYVDTDASTLQWATGLAPQPALRVEVFEVAGLSVQLRLLGMSHQVMVTRDGQTFSETVACLGEGGQPLPEQARTEHYRFRSHVAQHDPVNFEAVLTQLRGSLAQASANMLAGTFPGSPDAVTAIELTEASVHAIEWRTWHAYPQTDTIVTTESRYGPS